MEEEVAEKLFYTSTSLFPYLLQPFVSYYLKTAKSMAGYLKK
jgi:hypothetical protein